VCEQRGWEVVEVYADNVASLLIRETNCPPLALSRGGRHRQNGGRLQIRTLGDIKSESLGHQIGISGLRRNPQCRAGSAPASA
jgi:hypothetical protein